jgi:hypothetical protein
MCDRGYGDRAAIWSAVPLGDRLGEFRALMSRSPQSWTARTVGLALPAKVGKHARRGGRTTIEIGRPSNEADDRDRSQ